MLKQNAKRNRIPLIHKLAERSIKNFFSVVILFSILSFLAWLSLNSFIKYVVAMNSAIFTMYNLDEVYKIGFATLGTLFYPSWLLTTSRLKGIYQTKKKNFLLFSLVLAITFCAMRVIYLVLENKGPGIVTRRYYELYWEQYFIAGLYLPLAVLIARILIKRCAIKRNQLC